MKLAYDELGIKDLHGLVSYLADCTTGKALNMLYISM